MAVQTPTTTRALPGLARVRHALALLPDAVLALRDLAVGDPERAARRARRRAARFGVAPDAATPSAARVAVHSVLVLGLGTCSWFVAFLVVSGFARGPLYGLVDPGPYDHSWGGPNLVGAWAAHAWVWVATVPAAVALWWGLGALHARLTAQLLGAGRSRWAVAASTVLLVAVVLFLRAWVHQW